MANEHENTPFGSYGEFEPVPDDVDWDAHEAEALEYFETYDAGFAPEVEFYDYEPSPYDGTYSEM
jgi:hypothetical protein